LAGVGAQLLGTFQNVDGDGGAKEFLIATCYASIFLNIGASVSSLVALDYLGELASRPLPFEIPRTIGNWGRFVHLQKCCS